MKTLWEIMVHSHKTTMVAMVARAEMVSAVPILISNTVLVTVATRRKSLAGAGALMKTEISMATSRKRVWAAQLVRTL